MTARYHERDGGLIRYEDLADFEAEEAAPLRISYRGYDSLPDAAQLRRHRDADGAQYSRGLRSEEARPQHAAYLHVLTEAFKLAFADRYPYITDPRFAPDAPIQQLLSKRTQTSRRGLIKMDRAIAGVAPPGDPRSRPSDSGGS